MKVIVVSWFFMSNHSTSKEPLNKASKCAHLLQFHISAEHASRDYATNPTAPAGATGDREITTTIKNWKQKTGRHLQAHCSMGSSITERAAFLTVKPLMVHGAEMTVAQAY